MTRLHPDYARLLEDQGGKCAECGQPFTDGMTVLDTGKLYHQDCHGLITARRLNDRGDSAWLDAPPPRRWHRCHPASTGNVHAALIERCACGAIRVNHGRWMDRNSKRRHRAVVKDAQA